MNPPPAAVRRVPFHLGAVSQTLLVPLWARAEESRRRDGVLRDPKAEAVLRALDVDLGALREARASQLGCCVRSVLMDGWAREFLREHPDGNVIELGVGLNSRFERTDNGRAHWVELDLPEVIALRSRLFDAHPRRRMVGASLTDAGWLEALGERLRAPSLFVAEGVMVYLQREEVRALFARLRDAAPGAGLVFDAMTRPVVRFQSAHDAMRHFEARFTWSVDDPREVEGFAPGVRIERTESFYNMLYAHPRRLPAWMRLAGPLVARVWPPVRQAYTINLARLGAPPRA
jgi:O-methyltransferase involved in polyketide biosynthesis